MQHPAKTLILAALFLSPLAAEFDSDALPKELVTPTREFLETNTADARMRMTRFSDADLEKITNVFKKSHSNSERRLFWLSEELYRRNAERVSAERIRYLYYAVLAALGIITIFTVMTYRTAARRRPLPVSPATDFPAAVPVPQKTATKRSNRPAKKKKK